MINLFRTFNLFLLLSFPVLLNAQDATSFLVGIIEAHNRQLNDLGAFISPDAKCFINGEESDSSALEILTQNFEFLNSVYKHPQINVLDLVADKITAVAEWSFTDSIGEISNGIISIKLEDKKVSIVKIYNGKISEGFNESDSRGIRRLSGGPRGMQTSNKDQSWWYYLRVSQGGFVDPAGIHFSAPFECESPTYIAKQFAQKDLKGSYPDKQSASKAMQAELEALKKAGIVLHSTNVSCPN